MAYRKVILAEAQQEYRDIVGYLVGMLRSEQAARNFMEEFDKQVNLGESRAVRPFPGARAG